MALTALSRPNNTPVLIDSGTLALVLHTRQPDQTAADEGLSFFDRVRGNETGHYKNADWGFDTGVIFDDLARAGCALHPLPLVYGGKPYGTAWVNPNAFQSVITSAPSVSAGETEETIAVLLDIEGYGRIETTMPGTTLDAFMQAAAAEKPNLMRIDPKTAHARFYNPGYSIFDADRIESLRYNGNMAIDVNLYGAAMMGAGRIDFQLNSGDPNGNTLGNVIINRMARKMRGMLGIKDLNAAPVFNALVQRAQAYADKAEIRLMDHFCAAIAARAPQLVRIEYAQKPHYVDPARIACAYTYKDSVQIHFAKPAFRTHANDFGIHFKSAGDAKKSYATLCAITAAQPAP